MAVVMYHPLPDPCGHDDKLGYEDELVREVEEEFEASKQEFQAHFQDLLAAVRQEARISIKRVVDLLDGSRLRGQKLHAQRAGLCRQVITWRAEATSLRRESAERLDEMRMLKQQIAEDSARHLIEIEGLKGAVFKAKEDLEKLRCQNVEEKAAHVAELDELQRQSAQEVSDKSNEIATLKQEIAVLDRQRVVAQQKSEDAECRIDELRAHARQAEEAQSHAQDEREAMRSRMDDLIHDVRELETELEWKKTELKWKKTELKQTRLDLNEVVRERDDFKRILARRWAALEGDSRESSESENDPEDLPQLEDLEGASRGTPSSSLELSDEDIAAFAQSSLLSQDDSSVLFDFSDEEGSSTPLGSSSGSSVRNASSGSVPADEFAIDGQPVASELPTIEQLLAGTSAGQSAQPTPLAADPQVEPSPQPDGSEEAEAKEEEEDEEQEEGFGEALGGAEPAVAPERAAASPSATKTTVETSVAEAKVEEPVCGPFEMMAELAELSDEEKNATRSHHKAQARAKSVPIKAKAPEVSSWAAPTATKSSSSRSSSHRGRGTQAIQQDFVRKTRTPEEGAWYWQAVLPNAVILQRARLRYESLILREGPSSESPITGFIFLKTFFLARLCPNDPRWLEVIFADSTAYLCREGTSGAAASVGSNREDALIQLVKRPGQVLRDYHMVQEFSLATKATEALLALIQREQDAAGKAPFALPNDEYCFWRVPIRSEQSLPQDEAFADTSGTWQSQSAATSDGHKLMLCKAIPGELLQTLAVYGPTYLVPTMRNSLGECALVDDPLDILLPSGALDKLGVGSILKTPRPLENAVKIRGMEDMEVVRQVAEEALRWQCSGGLRAGGLPPGGVKVVRPETHGRSKQHRTFKVELPETGERFFMRCNVPVARSLGTRWRLPPLINEERCAAASRAFESAGLGPTRCASGPGYCLEQQAGSDIARESPQRWTVEELGKFMAKIHMTVDNTWSNDIVALFRELLPWAGDVGPCSHVWREACVRDSFVSRDEDFLRAWARNEEYKPRTPACRRVVANHGDFIPANIVRVQDGSMQLKVIDFEFSICNYAVQDLSYSIGKCCTNLEETNKFIKAYLREWGDLKDKTGIEEQRLVDLVKIDCSLFRRAMADLSPDRQGMQVESQTVEGARAAGGAGGILKSPSPGRHGGGRKKEPGEGDKSSQGSSASKASKGPGVATSGWKDTGGPPKVEPFGPVLRKVRRRLPDLPGIKSRPQLKKGPMSWWKATLAPGAELTHSEVLYSLGLLPSIEKRGEKQGSQVAGFVPLDKVVLAREVLDHSDWLEIILDGSGERYVRKEPLDPQIPGVVWEVEDSPADLLEQPKKVYSADMGGKATAATMELLYGGVDKAPPFLRKQLRECLQDGTSWWRTTDVVRVRRKPQVDGPFQEIAPKGTLMLAKPMAKQPSASSTWVELLTIAYDGATPLFVAAQLSEAEANTAGARLPEGRLPEAGRACVLLEKVESAAEVLSSWDHVFEASRMNANLITDVSKDVWQEDARRTGILGLTHLNRCKGNLDAKLVAQLSQYKWTFQLSMLNRSYAMRYDVCSGAVDPSGVPLILHQERFAAMRELLALHELSLGPEQLWERPGCHLEAWIGNPMGSQRAVEIVDAALLLAKLHTTAPLGVFDEYRELLRKFYPCVENADKGSHVWRRMLLPDFHQQLMRKTPEQQDEWANWQFKGRCKALPKCVVVHGDFHTGNLVYGSNGELKLIDFEYCHEGSPLEDLCVVMHSDTIRNRADRLAFARAYLGHGGRRVIEEEAENLVFDARCYRLVEKKLHGKVGSQVTMQELESTWNLARVHETQDARDLRYIVQEKSLTEATEDYLKWQRLPHNVHLGLLDFSKSSRGQAASSTASSGRRRH